MINKYKFRFKKIILTLVIFNILILGIGSVLGESIETKDISCIHCHSKEVIDFQTSVHFKDLLCTDCHQGNTSINGSVSTSAMNNIIKIPTKSGVPSICIKCHKNEVVTYKDSIHWKNIEEGRTEAPSCLDCHGVHNILSYKDPNSTTYFENIPETCSNCHENQTKMSAWYYGINTDRFDTYKKSYHYRAIQLKNANRTLPNGKGLATCPDCHENHDTKNASDPTSTIYPENLALTCGKDKCHSIQNAVVYGGKVHEGLSIYLFNLDIKKLVTYFYVLMILFELTFTFGLIFLGITSKIELRKRH
jgi:nitrate/TMAO reductase-like tetraheme cytochrome c subunit